ncbi:Putative mono-oxygenase ydhR [Allopseudospirillum japonicum]|uniref:Mono-oxygenase ydhR n=1 Tax=Allopseudospirillum japonicum TaxID=64971 RepID=A0A1H6QM54_9GAMM|nr:monooxygenase [Allopseudospirillum japonicum]SEI40395.1 Putative mono-oxygenase ydhR [Allopseudospirillum japonicum]
MPYLLQVDFPYSGPFGTEMVQAMQALAADIAQEEDLLWKIWTENEKMQQAGGVYLFANESRAQAYLEKHQARLQAAGITKIRAHIFAVNTELSLINRAPIT